MADADSGSFDGVQHKSQCLRHHWSIFCSALTGELRLPGKIRGQGFMNLVTHKRRLLAVHPHYHIVVVFSA